MTLSKSIFRVALATGFLLLLLLVANMAMTEMNWTLDDFITAGLLLFCLGTFFTLMARVGSNIPYRLGAGIAVMAGFMLIWGNLAVGFIGSEDNPANLLYGGVLAVAIIGSIAARSRPRGLANAMFAAALTQFLVPLVAALIWKPEVNLGMVQVLVLNAVFALLWVGSGLLFRRASNAIGPGSGHRLA